MVKIHRNDETGAVHAYAEGWDLTPAELSQGAEAHGVGVPLELVTQGYAKMEDDGSASGFSVERVPFWSRATFARLA